MDRVSQSLYSFGQKRGVPLGDEPPNPGKFKKITKKFIFFALEAKVLKFSAEETTT
jgi:hypothetical protein